MSWKCFICGRKIGLLSPRATTKDADLLCFADVNNLFITDECSKFSIPDKYKNQIFKMNNTEIQAQIVSINRAREKAENGILCCPYCASENVKPLGADKKNFSVGKAAAGAVLAGGIGALAGLAGKKTGMTDFVCMDCGKQFKR